MEQNDTPAFERTENTISIDTRKLKTFIAYGAARNLSQSRISQLKASGELETVYISEVEKEFVVIKPGEFNLDAMMPRATAEPLYNLTYKQLGNYFAGLASDQERDLTTSERLSREQARLITELKASSEALNQDHTSLTRAYEIQQEENAAQLIELTQLRQASELQLAEISRLSPLEAALDGLKLENQELIDAHQILQGKNNALEEGLSRLAAQDLEKAAKITALEAAAGEQQAALSTLTQTAHSQAAKIEALEAANKALTETAAGQQRDLDRQSTLTERLDWLTHTHESLSAAHTLLLEEHRRLASSAANPSSDGSDIRSDLAALKSQVTDLVERLARPEK